MNSGRGRPKGGSDARERLTSAARALFIQHGYVKVSGRAVARQAEVDHALVNYYFGSKQGLFAEVMALEFSPTVAVESVLSGAAGKSPQRVSEELIATVVSVWDSDVTGPGLMSMFEGVLGDASLRNVMGGFITAEALSRMRLHIGGADAARRASGISTVISGLVYSRYIMRVEPLASMPPRDVVRTLAPMVALQLRS